MTDMDTIEPAILLSQSQSTTNTLAGLDHGGARKRVSSNEEVPPTATTTAFQSTVTLFDYAHSRKKHQEPVTKNHTIGHEEASSWKHLLKPPVVRQFVAGSCLVRELAEREAARFELFFDLVFVGVIHQLAEQATDTAAATTWGIFQFVCFFWMSWSIWQDARSFINTSGTDDIPQRVFVLIVMCLLFGFSSNASAVEIKCPPFEDAETTAEAAARLLRRAVEDSGNALLPGGCELVAGWEKNIRGALGFFLVAKLLRVVLLVGYGYWLPRFREAHFVRAQAIAVASVLYLPIIWSHKTILLLVLPIISITLELTGSYTVACGLWLVEKISKTMATRGPKTTKGTGFLPVHHSVPEGQEKDIAVHVGDQESMRTVKVRHFSRSFTPALSIEHLIERTSMFVVLVLGEMILSSTFRALKSQAGIHTQYLRCVFGIFIAYCYNWIYADSDGCRCYYHALRRHWFTSITWTHLHFPLCASLIFASAALAELIASDSAHETFKWFFAGGSAVTIFSIALIGLTHRSLDEPGSPLVHRYIRLFARGALAVVFACLPLAKMNSTGTLATHAGLLLALVVFETVGKFGTLGSDERIAIALNKVVMDGDEDYDLDEEIRELGCLPIEVLEHELLDHERGEDDVGVEADLGELRVLKIGPNQRLAYTF